MSETLHQIQSKYGTYAVYGNHDVKETLVAGFSIGASKKALRDPRMDEFMEKAGITVLEDESELMIRSFILLEGWTEKRMGEVLQNESPSKN